MRSVWMEGAPTAPAYPSLSSGCEADTVVVGGGITGVTTAWLLAEAGQRVVLLEAHRIGASNTGLSTGNLYGTVSGGLTALRKHWSSEVVRRMVGLRLEAIDTIETLVDRLGLDCGFARRTLHTGIAHDEGQAADALQHEFDAAAEAGLAPRWLEASAWPLRVARGFAIDGQAQFDPYRYTVGLAEAAARHGVHLHEGSAVVEVDTTAGRVRTAGGHVSARHIVLATHTPIGMHLVQTKMPVYRECGVSAPVQGRAVPEGIFWVRDLFRSVRGHHADGRDWLVVVGDRHKPGHEKPAQLDALRSYAREQFGTQEFDHAWSAQQYRPADGLPYIGALGEKLYVATGFAADGLTWGTVAAQLLGEAIQGRAGEAGRILDPGRFTPFKSMHEWLAENKVVMQHLIAEQLAPGKAKGLENVPPGEGLIAEVDGDKCAVYRSPEGTLSVVSPTCTHLGCQVHWNAVARSWDCACHGSRFAPDGSVIEGPATRPLERIDV